MPTIPFHITVCNPLRLPSPSLERLQHMEIFKCAEMQTRNLVFYVSVWRIGECALSNPSFFLNCELVFQRNISLYFSDDNGYDDSDYNEQRNSSMKCCNAAQKCYLLTFIENESGSGGVIIGNFVEIRIVLRCSRLVDLRFPEYPEHVEKISSIYWTPLLSVMYPFSRFHNFLRYLAYRETDSRRDKRG